MPCGIGWPQSPDFSASAGPVTTVLWVCPPLESVEVLWGRLHWGVRLMLSLTEDVGRRLEVHGRKLPEVPGMINLDDRTVSLPSVMLCLLCKLPCQGFSYSVPGNIRLGHYF